MLACWVHGSNGKGSKSVGLGIMGIKAAMGFLVTNTEGCISIVTGNRAVSEVGDHTKVMDNGHA